ncbi:hypothetical protein [Methylocaldum sp.]|uniref:hypothetical protein n=1 Tax=Methylocaldum sp. TaxID=1969727 RepID=UPI002D25418F|nr:hypothetical protein [Methylocaldum sp.]HYE36053.1 hypothetical protein [Methylocaldum sp.]
MTLLTAMALAVFFEADSCIDAGGQYKSTGACYFHTPHEYVPQFSRRGLYVFWAMFLARSFLPGWLSYKLVHRIGRTRGSYSQTDAPANDQIR